MYQRFIAALLALFLLSGCGAAEETQKPVDAPPSTAAEDAAAGAPAAAPEPEPESEPEADPASDAGSDTDDNPISAPQADAGGVVFRVCGGSARQRAGAAFARAGGLRYDVSVWRHFLPDG